jgi:hypothetical protein
LLIVDWECSFWLPRKGLETGQFFFAIYVVLDMPIEQPLKNAKIIAERTLVLAVLKSVKRQFTFLVHLLCLRKNKLDYVETVFNEK